MNKKLDKYIKDKEKTNGIAKPINSGIQMLPKNIKRV